VADERGTASAKHVRAVLTGVLQHAVEMGVLPTNAMRSIGRVAAKRDPAPPAPVETRRNTKRALTDAERSAVLAYVGNWSSEPGLHPGTAAQRRAVADLVRMLAGTGMRIGEALTLRWEHLDLRTGATHVPGTKSASAARTVTLPDWLRRAIVERALLVGRTSLVFAAPRLSDREKPWNASNCSHAVTAVLAAAGVPWARSNTFRKTVASRLSDAGGPLREVADQLGHRDAGFTASTYLGRSFTGEKSALAEHL
jgi:integrase